MKAKLIAACGMNCGLCAAYLREKNTCPGCNVYDANMPVSRKRCVMRSCGKRGESRFCFSCSTFPCEKLKHLDKRYRTKYGMSMLANLESIKALGIRAFVRKEEKRWVRGGKVFCVHNKKRYDEK
jgi:hypothetical protein